MQVQCWPCSTVGMPLQRIRQSVDILREQVPELHAAALGRCGVSGRGAEVASWSVTTGGCSSRTGSFVLEFDSKTRRVRRRPSLARDCTRPQRDRLGEAPADRRATLGATRLVRDAAAAVDSDPETFYDDAIAAYRQCAIALDDEFADAHCNLGAALYNKGRRRDARASFERCLALQPAHVEARFNLANLLDEAGEVEAALESYLVALAGDPFYADLHINLALLYEKLGRPGEGLGHWRRYLQIEPDGALADIARQRLRSQRP